MLNLPIMKKNISGTLYEMCNIMCIMQIMHIKQVEYDEEVIQEIFLYIYDFLMYSVGRYLIFGSYKAIFRSKNVKKSSHSYVRTQFSKKCIISLHVNI